jgi:hypothetical protein
MQEAVDYELRDAIRETVNSLRQDPKVIAQVKQEVANYNAERRNHGANAGT